MINQPAYEYRGLIATFWDLLRGDTSNWPDRFFYRDLMQVYGQPALDVGCGTGRLLLDFLSQGIDIEGVDDSPEMVAILREKARKLGVTPTLFEQKMELLSLPRKYMTIIVPSSSFQLLCDPGPAAEAMTRFFHHLLPGGVLAMPFMTWSAGDSFEFERVQTATRPEDGAVVRRTSIERYDVQNQIGHTEDLYEITLGGKVIASERHRRSPAVRWYTQDQAVRLYHDAGFTGLEVFSGFTNQPASAEDRVFSIIGKRARG